MTEPFEDTPDLAGLFSREKRAADEGFVAAAARRAVEAQNARIDAALDRLALDEDLLDP